MNFNEVINSRRAVNFFDPEKEVPEILIKQVIDMASKSPSSYNLQPWSLMIIKDHHEKMKLRKLAFDQPKVSEAPVVFIVLADKNGWQKANPFAEKNFQEMIKANSITPDRHDWYGNTLRKLYGSSEETKLAFACKNAGFFAMSLMFSAKSLGLETHPMDGFDHEGVRKTFSIPDNYWIPLLIAMGYFNKNQTIAPPKWRKTYEEIVVTFSK